MPTLNRFILPVCLIILLNITFHSTLAQITDKSHKYVVTAVYLKQSDAEEYVNQAKGNGLDAKFLKHNYPEKRTLYYCYTYVSKDLKASLSESEKLRSQAGFEETWVFVVLKDPGEDRPIASNTDEKGDNGDEDTETQKTEAVEEEEELVGIESGADEVQPDEPEVEKIDETVEAVKYYKVLVNTLNARNLKPVPATIKVVDGVRSTLVANIKSNEIDSIKERKSGQHKVQIVSESVGFKKASYEIDLDNPINDTTTNYAAVNDGVLELEFPLQALKTGDYQILYNIYFYNDASIMKAHSKFELESLHQLLEERKSMKIRIHGHTNGKSFGKIIKLEEGDDNWFNITPKNKETSGSAVELSRLRGETIKRYLVTQGVSADRLEIKGWGGKKMIHDEKHPLAHQNVRVEIEVIEE